MKYKTLIRHTRSTDIKPLLELQKRVYPTIQPWRENLLLKQIDTFPQGQIIAEIDAQLVGAASSLMVLWDEWNVDHTWKEITARGSFDTINRRRSPCTARKSLCTLSFAARESGTPWILTCNHRIKRIGA